MKKKVVAVFLIVSVLMSAACNMGGSGSRSRRDRDDDDERETRTSRTSRTEETEETTEATEETRPTIETAPLLTEPSSSGLINTSSGDPAIYESYLEILEDNESEIEAYNWMRYENAVEPDDHLIAPGNVPCALYDITGDGIEELLIMKTDNGYAATLEIYTYDSSSSSAVQIYSEEGFDVMAGGGGEYLIGTLEDNFLFIFRGEGDEEWTDDYSVYGYLPATHEYTLTGHLKMHSDLDDAGMDYVYDYELNGEVIDADAFEEAKAAVCAYFDTIIFYNYIFDSDMINGVSGKTPIGMSYDDMHDYLESLI